MPGARRRLSERGADVVLGGGGFVAGPAGLAARTMRIPLVLTEADRHLGLANRLLARGADRVCLAFEMEGVEGDQYLVTGRPVNRGVLEADRDRARDRFGIEAGRPCLLVMGGSLGARTINRAAIEAFAERPGRDFEVVHVAGSRDYPELRQRLDAAGHGGGYTLLEYEPDMGDGLAACDLVLARSGGSVFELTARGRPSLLVPYPHATGDHQAANAEWLAEAGAAEVIADADLTAKLAMERVSALLGDGPRLAAMSAAAASLARPDAAAVVADEVLAAARGKR